MSKILILAFVFTITWQLSCGIGLNCTFGMVNWSTIGSIYTCTASISIDAGNRETITAVNGTHESGRTNADVLGLWMSNRGLEYFPVNIAQFFPNIKGLSFPYNAIFYVNNQHLISLPNLSFLNLLSNRITSLDSNLFSGLSMEWIRLDNNNIKHVGHDFILPNDGYINFQSNPCINILATTSDAITALRFDLLVNCPPTISQIEDTLESRPNWLTNINGQVKILVNKTDGIEQSHSEMEIEIKNLTITVTDLENRNLQLTNKVTDLQQRNVELTSEVTDLQHSNVELTNEVTELTNKLTDLQQSNVELTNDVTDLQQSNVELTDEVTDLRSKNSQLETRVGFLNTRAGNLEERVATLESIIESRLGLKIDEAISENVN